MKLTKYAVTRYKASEASGEGRFMARTGSLAHAYDTVLDDIHYWTNTDTTALRVLMHAATEMEIKGVCKVPGGFTVWLKRKVTAVSERESGLRWEVEEHEWDMGLSEHKE